MAFNWVLLWKDLKKNVCFAKTLSLIFYKRIVPCPDGSRHTCCLSRFQYSCVFWFWFYFIVPKVFFLKMIKNNLTLYRKPSGTSWRHIIYVVMTFCHRDKEIVLSASYINIMCSARSLLSLLKKVSKSSFILSWKPIFLTRWKEWTLILMLFSGTHAFL